MSGFSQRVFRNSAFGMAGQIAIKLLSFVFSVLIVRRLGASTFGQYAAVLAFGATFAILSDLGLAPYAVREVARWRDVPGGREQARLLYGNIMALRLSLSLLAVALLIIVAFLTHRPLLMIGAIALNSLGLVMYGIQGSSEAILTGFERLDLTSGAKVLSQLAFVILGGAALLLGLNYYGLIAANLAAVGLLTYTCWRAVRSLGLRPLRPAIRTWLRLLRTSLPFGVIGFALGLSYKFDTVLLNIYRSDAEVGYYSAAYNLVFSAVVLSNAVNLALYPSLSRQRAQAPETLPVIYERVFRYLFSLSLPIAAGAWALAGQLVPALYRAAYLPSVPALQIIIWVVPLMFASEFLGYIVVVGGEESRVARALIISTAFNVALNLLVVPRFGYVGAAVMTVLTEAVLVGQYLWGLRATLRCVNLQSAVLRPLLAALLMGAALILTRTHFPLLANVAVGGAIYLGLLVALGTVGRTELHFFRGILVARAGKTA